MKATMIKIERNEKMAAAINRCKSIRPKVRRIDAQTIEVTSPRGEYIVKVIEPREGLRLAECTCKAGVDSQLCYHVPAALAAPLAAPHTPRKSSSNDGVLVKRATNGVRIDGWMV